ncbi:MAG TPA: anti-sigma factor antagonist [Firmicutes bacterium]|nr:anti-sigma factor antagonist [Bacillota bacterium]
MNLSLETIEDVLLVRMRGELDLETAAKFRVLVEEALDHRPGLKHLILDVSGLSFIDSSGLGAILGRYRQFAERGGRVFVVGVQPGVGRLLELSGLFRVVEVAATAEEALARVQGEVGSVDG